MHLAMYVSTGGKTNQVETFEKETSLLSDVIGKMKETFEKLVGKGVRHQVSVKSGNIATVQILPEDETVDVKVFMADVD